MHNQEDDDIQDHLYDTLVLNFPEYDFDTRTPPFRSSYDNYHILGRTKPQSPKRSKSDESQQSRARSDSREHKYIVARVSKHGVRIEREFKQAQLLFKDDDHNQYFLRPLRLVHMQPLSTNQTELIASIVEAPGSKYIHDLATLVSEKSESISYILDFAIGACEVLEIIHHRHGLMHGEIRKDAFHFDQITRRVRILNFGSGATSFVSRLTNTGWSDLLLEAGVNYKLQFYAPEQTGRLPVEPDMRTDIYALGIGIWTLATGRLPFAGSEPLAIIQAVLSQPLPPISTFRPELQIISQIVAKMTRKTISERYNSVSSAKRDFEEAKRSHEAGRHISNFEAGRDDVSPVFKLPPGLVGRTREQQRVLAIIEALAAGVADYAQVNGTSDRITRSPSIALASVETLSGSPSRTSQVGSIHESRRRSSIPEHLAALQREKDHAKSVVTIAGKSGYGKTFLLHHLHQAVRSKLLTAIVRLERMKAQPLSPVLKLISSLFKQIFSDADIDASTDKAIRDQLRPFWPTLCPHLELPIWLLDSVNTRTNTKQMTSNLQPSRFTQSLIEALHIVSVQKRVCLMLDDVDLIDDESLEILRAIHNTAMPVILVMTYNASKAGAGRVERLAGWCTRVDLDPFSEDETTSYVAETIHKRVETCRAFGSLVFDRTGGVPLHIKSFLESCHATDLVKFSWQNRCWQYDIDRIAECGPTTDDRESVEVVIHQRYRTLSNEVQALLSWAAMLGMQFNLSLLRTLNDTATIDGCTEVPIPICDCLEALQLAISKFILRPTDDEDLFRFTDDTYWSAACLLNRDYDKTTMHFVIAKSMVLATAETTSVIVYQAAEHIIDSLQLILARIDNRDPFMQSLMTAAMALRTTGALGKSASFCDAVLQLMDGWTEKSYSIYSQAAEIYHLVGKTDLALSILEKIEQNVAKICDRIPTIITRSRIYADQGDDLSASRTISSTMNHFKLRIPQSMEDCDAAFELIDNNNSSANDAGPLLSEAIMTSLWMHGLVPYQHAAALATSCKADFDQNPHMIIGLIYLSAVALLHLGDFDLCLKLRKRAVQAMSTTDCPRSVWNRALVLRALLIGHLEVGSREQIDDLNQALEALSTNSDRSLLLLSIGTLVVLRVCIADDLESLLRFIEDSTQSLYHWEYEKPNGVVLVCTRQVVRTLRGITRIDAADTIMCDEEHDEAAFLQGLEDERYQLLRVLYTGCKLVMQNFYGYHKEAMELGLPLMPWVNDVRISLFFNAIFYQIGLAIAVVLREEPDRKDREQLLEHIVSIKSRISLIAAAGIPQCEAWLLVLEGEIANDASSLRSLSLAVETIEGRGSPIEEGICLEIYIRCLVRIGGALGVQALVERCSASYARAGASAKAQQVLRMNGHSIKILPILPASNLFQSETMEAYGPAWQQTRVNTFATTENGTTSSSTSTTSDESPHQADQNSIDTPSKRTSQLALGSLDIIDLHSIISSSQAMSSELNIDRLLQSLTKIIAESTGAYNCSIVVHTEEKDCWTVAAESRSSNAGIRLEDWKDTIAKHANVYVLRFREELMIHDTTESELFSSIASARHDDGLSVLCVPLIHSGTLLGSVYCQASPNTFTDRTMTLVRLLVTQISICLSNAILFKCLERASAENLSMLVLQKEATEQAKHAEIKAVDNLRQKEEAMRAKDLFLANISHELRTPLNGVIGLADMLQDTKLDSQQSDCARSIAVCADTLLSVINDSLDFSKLQAGKMQCVNSPLHLSQKLRDIVHALRAARSKPGVATVDDIQIDPGLVVSADLTRLQQVFMNLISNAYKFTLAGQVVVSAKEESCNEGVISVRFSVKDTGIGIPSHTQQKLFSPFTQADSSTERTYGGTGLGLSICKAIVEEVMGGQIWLESEVDHGTTVTFVIPFENVEAPSNLAVRRAPAVLQKSVKSAKQLRICIAEDNAINRKIAVTLVNKLGHLVEAFENGRQALDALYQGHFDIVLMDLQMPVLDGYGATQEIRKSSSSRVRDIIIIALTASTIKGDQERCIEAGMDAYVTKPVRLPMLKEAIENFLPP